MGCRFAFAPEAIAWFRPRPSLAAFFRQYYRYARGDGKADLWRARHTIRYATYLTAVALLVRRSRLSWLLLVGVAAYSRRPCQRLDLRGLSGTRMVACRPGCVCVATPGRPGSAWTYGGYRVHGWCAPSRSCR